MSVAGKDGWTKLSLPADVMHMELSFPLPSIFVDALTLCHSASLFEEKKKKQQWEMGQLNMAADMACLFGLLIELAYFFII